MLSPNQYFDQTYRVERQIGRGGTSDVYLAYHTRLNKYVVVKRVRMAARGTELARAEVDILKNLHHPGLPQVYDILQIGREVYTVMDYVEGRGFDVILESHPVFDEKTLTLWLRQLLEVLDYLHTRRPPVIHSDIKPGNIILTERGSVTLIDFNISVGETGTQTVGGYSMFYAAPEQVRLAQDMVSGRPPSAALDARSDLYSLAATFYSLITGCAPSMDGANPPLQKIAAGRYTPGFLAVLDRAMERDPDRRWRSAKKMLAALDRLARQSSQYRMYAALQAVSWIVSAALIGAGLFCVIRGVRESGLEEYRAVYRQVERAVESGSDEAILQSGQRLLEDAALRAVLEDSPRDHSALLHAMGDCFYNRSEYTQAAEYYREALDAAEKSDPNLAVYCEDAAIALALSGDTAAARQVLEQSALVGLDSGRQELIRAAIALREGRAEDCEAAVRSVLNGGDASLCARACLLAADAAGTDIEKELSWLEAADGYERTRQTLRRLGEACMRQFAYQTNPNRAKEYADRALAYYEALCSYAYPAVEDRINLAVTQMTVGKFDAAVRTLTLLRQEEPDDYRVEMNLAFAYDALGDSAQAAACGSRALRLWSETPATDREEESSEAMQQLRELQRRLNF